MRVAGYEAFLYCTEQSVTIMKRLAGCQLHCVQAGAVRALSLSDETLFLAGSGRVRAMDVSSGGHAGERLVRS